MGISKIGSLFASNVDPVLRPQAAGQQGAGAQAQSQQTQAQASTDAVVYSRSMGTKVAAPTSTEDSRAARVQQLKSDVGSGAYKPDTEKVAVAVLKELA
jgi:anti-sigma28 factor (negative regulator of flagellin synthesis)